MCQACVRLASPRAEKRLVRWTYLVYFGLGRRRRPVNKCDCTCFVGLQRECFYRTGYFWPSFPKSVNGEINIAPAAHPSPSCP